jgi:hypothetical protein
MRRTLDGVLLSLLIVFPVACSGVPATQTATATQQAAAISATETSDSSSPTGVAVTATPAISTPTPSATDTFAPSPTATLDATRSAAMTLAAIRLAVTASGVPEGSTQFDDQVAATQCAIIPPPTSTPLPWALQPRDPYQVSGNCLGNDLPGRFVRVWQGGSWIEANAFGLANPADLALARQRYLAYLDVISFRNGPPGTDFPARLAEQMNSAGVSPSPESCLADDIASRVAALGQQGDYVRLDFTQPIRWADKYDLFISVGEVQLALSWSTSAVRQELVSLDKGTVVKQATLSQFAGTAWLTYDNAAGQWRIADDDGGYYCHLLSQFAK